MYTTRDLTVKRIARWEHSLILCIHRECGQEFCMCWWCCIFHALHELCVLCRNDHDTLIYDHTSSDRGDHWCEWQILHSTKTGSIEYVDWVISASGSCMGNAFNKCACVCAHKIWPCRRERFCRFSTTVTLYIATLYALLGAVIILWSTSWDISIYSQWLATLECNLYGWGLGMILRDYWWSNLYLFWDSV